MLNHAIFFLNTKHFLFSLFNTMGRLFSSNNQPVAKAKKSSVAGKHLITAKKSCLLSKLAFAVKSAKIKENVSEHNNDDHMDTDDNHVKVEPMLTIMEEKGPWGY